MSAPTFWKFSVVLSDTLSQSGRGRRLRSGTADLLLDGGPVLERALLAGRDPLSGAHAFSSRCDSDLAAEHARESADYGALDLLHVDGASELATPSMSFGNSRCRKERSARNTRGPC